MRMRGSSPVGENTNVCFLRSLCGNYGQKLCHFFKYSRKESEKLRQDLSDERLINKILYPKKILCLIAFYEILMLSIFFLLIHLAHNMEGIIAAIGMPGIYTYK